MQNAQPSSKPYLENQTSRPPPGRSMRQVGLSEETIARLGVRYASAWEAWQLVGWKTNSGGIVFPYFVDGQQVGCRIKLDTPYVNKRGEKVKYASPAKSPIHLYIPPTLDPAALRDITLPLLIGEGEKDTAKAIQEGFAAIGIAGADSWRQQGLPLAEWELITLNGRFVTICLDSDVARNPNVQRAEREPAAFLRSRGAIVKAVRLPDPNGEKLGLGAMSSPCLAASGC
jgi:hypothetical protein